MSIDTSDYSIDNCWIPSGMPMILPNKIEKHSTCEIQEQQLNRCNSLFTLDILIVHIFSGSQFIFYAINLFHADQTWFVQWTGRRTKLKLTSENKCATRTWTMTGKALFNLEKHDQDQICRCSFSNSQLVHNNKTSFPFVEYWSNDEKYSFVLH